MSKRREGTRRRWPAWRVTLFLVALAVFFTSLGFLCWDLWLYPAYNQQKNDQLTALYRPQTTLGSTDEGGSDNASSEEEESADTTDAYTSLSAINPDIRAWLSFPSSSPYWHGVDYPVVQTTDNSYYLTHDFYGETNKNGTLFFDYRNDFSDGENHNRVSLIFGHNMRSGQMLASLNQLLGGVAYARSAPVITLDLFSETEQYLVFAVLIIDPDEASDFSYMRTDFSDDDDFLQYVAGLQERSWYLYSDVDVTAEDQLLVLSTCSNTSQTHLSDGRTVVAARKLREGESADVNTAHITENLQPLQPLVWYKKEGLSAPY